MKTILITGINGFLGSYLAKSLRKEYIIIGLENSINNLFRIQDDKFQVYSSKINIETIFKENQIYGIIHSATIYRKNHEPIEKLIETNVQLPVKLYELANKYECKIFLNTDSFFNNPEYNYSYLPDYTLSKKHVLEWLKLIHGKCKMINMKIFHMYGPEDSSTKFIPSIIKRLKDNEPIIETTSGEQTRDFIYIDDVVSAFKCVIDSFQIKSFPNDEFHVGTGSSISLKKFLLIAKKVTSSTTKFKFGALPYREHEIMISESDNTELKKMGWFPRNSISSGIKKVINLQFSND